MEGILGRRCYDQEVWEFSAREFAANIVDYANFHDREAFIFGSGISCYLLILCTTHETVDV